MNKTWFIILGVIAATLIGWGIWDANQPGELDAFAQCLEEEGAIFYGTFWCPYCNEQKEMFGRSAGELPYVECSTPDGNRQTQECREAGIEGYPTWEFQNEEGEPEREGGVLSLQQLADRTGCSLPTQTQE